MEKLASRIAFCHLIFAVALLLYGNAQGQEPWEGKATPFQKFTQYDFSVDDLKCKIVLPKKAAAGKPWVWRARFWGRVQPKLDAALLKQGFHIAYVDVANLFGSPDAIDRGDRFYKFMTEEKGFAKKPALIGVSRGGLFVYNWANRNPDQVACIYADAPVCQIKSWPGGKGAGKGASKQWKSCLEAYGFDEDEAVNYSKNPIDNLAPIAKANIPLLHVVGDDDDTVPVVENTSIIESRYKELGGKIEVIHKPGVGHHPHGLTDPQSTLDFIVKHTRQEKKDSLRVLNFQADNGFVHKSNPEAIKLVQRLGEKNGWEVITTEEAASLTELDLSTFNTIVFNNNCGNEGQIMNRAQQQALQKYVRSGGGFLAVHCAGAIWKEGGDFQTWYEGLVGALMVDHPKVQKAKLIVEDRDHIATRHLPKEWIIKDEFHRFGSNPRDQVNVLIAVDESSYKGKQKMGGDHPFVWYHEYDGGRSFFTSLGHTKEIYHNPNFEKMIEGAIEWTGGAEATVGQRKPTDGKKAEAKEPASPTTTENSPNNLPIKTGLYLDLDANQDVEVEDKNRVISWQNQVKGNAADVFVKQDQGRKAAGSGRPTLKTKVDQIGGNNTLIFKQQELVNMDQDAFDHMVTGNGYTWFSVMSVYKQKVGKKDVNSFFGNLRNGSPYEGFWGNLMDDNRVWMGTRNGILKKGKPSLWDKKLNPCVATSVPIDTDKYYLVMGRMGAGKESVNLELFINSSTPVDSKTVPVNPKADPSKMAVGQERDATNHPGKESFDGEIARFLIYDRPLNDDELGQTIEHLSKRYKIEIKK